MYSFACNAYLEPLQIEKRHLISDLKSDQQKQGPKSCFMQNIDVVRRIESLLLYIWVTDAYLFGFELEHSSYA